MNTVALRNYKASLTMTDRQEQILTGMLLGDAHLERQRGSVAARIKIEHSLTQSAYVAWKFNEWREWVRTPPTVRQKRNRLGTLSLNIGFTTLSHLALEEFRTRFYVNRRKVIPPDLELTSLSMAVWFMDDGTKIHRTVNFSVHNFSTSSIALLQKLLLQKKIMSTVQSDGKGKRLYVKQSSFVLFKRLVKPYIVKCMAYKLP
jgi:ABC-type uncharacterized transport system YnjBCD permease subunit